jgi:hypothetical protein
MADDNDNELHRGAGGGGLYSFDAFTTKAKATRTLETYDEKNNRLVNFVASSDAFKFKLVATTDLV